MQIKHTLSVGVLLIAAINAELTYLATFDGQKETTWQWREQNDPVMGITRNLDYRYLTSLNIISFG